MLDKYITDILDEIYVKNNIELYLDKCSQNFEIDPNSIGIIEKHKFSLESSTNNIWPSRSFYIKFGEFKKDRFKVLYSGQLLFSKLVKAYSLDFFYEVDNIDPDAYSPSFTNIEDEPLTIKQAYFFDEFKENLQRLGFNRITAKEKKIVIRNINYKSPNDLYSGQVDLWTALTHDVLDKTPD
ncbi:MAG: hypothetical protein H7263_02300 [Candidatus Sericytochromatia bacterium]|nr:hypothetical protein [Candidatus Sericytochromatia bacterium]